MPTVAELDIQVDLKDNGVQNDILQLQAMLQRLATEDPDISVRVSAAAAEKEFEDLKRRAEELEANVVNLETEADVKVALAQLEELQRAMRGLDRSTVNIDVDLDTQGALAHMAALKVALNDLKKQKIEIDKDGSNVRTLNQISAAAQRASGTIRGLTTAVIAFGPALVPIAAVATAGMLGLGAAFVAAGAGAALFAGVSVTVLKPVAKAVSEITKANEAYNKAVTDKQREAAENKIRAIYSSLTPVQKALALSIFDLRNAWQAFAKSFEPQIFALATEAIQTLTGVLPRLSPLMHNVVGAIQELQTWSIRTFKNPVWQEFFANITSHAAPALISLGKSMLNIATGFAGILNAFFPFANGMTKGLEDMTARFAAWGTNLENNPGFKKFIEYVRENTPKVLNLISSLVGALVAIVQAAAPIGKVLVSMFSGLFDAISAINSVLPGFTTGLLVFAGISAIFVNMIGPILAVINIVNLLIPLWGALSTAFQAAAAWVYATVTPFIGVALAIAAVIAVLVLAYKYVDSFREGVDKLVDRLQAMGTSILNTVKPALDAIVKFFQDEWQKMVDWFTQNQSTFQAAWQNITAIVSYVLNGLIEEINGALDVIVAIWNAVWPGLSTILQGVWTVISGIISGVLQVIRGIIQVFAGILTGDWSAIWSGLGTILGGVWTAIVAILKGAWQIIVGLFQVAIGVIAAAWSAIWTPLSAFLTGVWGLITSATSTGWGGLVAIFNGFVGILSAIWSFIWNGLVAQVTVAFGLVAAAVTIGWNILVFIFQAFVSQVTALWNAFWAFFGPPATAAFNIVVAAVTGFTQIMNTIFNGMATVVIAIWNAFWTVFNSVANIALTIVTGVISVGISVITALFNAGWAVLTAITTTAWNAIVAVVTFVVNGMVAQVQAGFNLMQSVVSVAWNAISTITSFVWNAMVSYVTAMVNSLIAVVTTGFNAALAVVTFVWNAMRDQAVAAWNLITSIVTTAINLVVSTVRSGTDTAVNLWKTGWDNFGRTVSDAIGKILGYINDLASRMISAILAIGKRLYDAGASIMGQLGDGIRSRVDDAVNAVKGAVDKMTGFLPGSPAERGPLSGRGYALYRGQRFIEDLTRGLSDQRGLYGVASGIASILDQATSPMSNIPSITSALGSSYLGGGSMVPMQRSASVTVEAGAVVLQLPPGMSADEARQAFEDSADTIADALLTALKKR